MTQIMILYSLRRPIYVSRPSIISSLETYPDFAIHSVFAKLSTSIEKNAYLLLIGNKLDNFVVVFFGVVDSEVRMSALVKPDKLFVL